MPPKTFDLVRNSVVQLSTPPKTPNPERTGAEVGRDGALVGVLAVDDVIGHVTAELGKLVALQAIQHEREHVRRP